MINFGEIDPTLASLIDEIVGEASKLDEESDGASWADVSFAIEELMSDPEVLETLETLWWLCVIHAEVVSLPV